MCVYQGDRAESVRDARAHTHVNMNARKVGCVASVCTHKHTCIYGCKCQRECTHTHIHAHTHTHTHTQGFISKLQALPGQTMSGSKANDYNIDVQWCGVKPMAGA